MPPLPHRPLRYGMVGGGPGAFIGAVHRRAAALDGLATLVAGSFSADPAKSRAQGEQLGLDGARVYGSYEEMAAGEAALPAERRIDFVVIATPNHLHFPVARAFVQRGFHVICDKPLTTKLADAETLCHLVARHDVVFALTHNYAGYPLIKQARALVRAGELGAIRRVAVDYVQGWLAEPIEANGQKQAAWRTDPSQAGAGALGDIGSHAEHLVRYVTGLETERVFADISSVVPGRRVEDDAAVLLRFGGGARGVLTCSQIATGEENELRLRVYGTRASLDWTHSLPNELRVRYAEGPQRIFTRGGAGLDESAARAARLPAGHPEGFLEAFANVYANALRTIAARIAVAEPDALDLDFPTVQDGARGVHFIEAALRSAASGTWTDAAYSPPAT